MLFYIHEYCKGTYLTITTNCYKQYQLHQEIFLFYFTICHLGLAVELKHLKYFVGFPARNAWIISKFFNLTGSQMHPCCLISFGSYKSYTYCLSDLVNRSVTCS